MPSSRTGRHRRPRRSHAPRAATTAGFVGVGLVLPLVAAASSSSAAADADAYSRRQAHVAHDTSQAHHPGRVGAPGADPNRAGTRATAITSPVASAIPTTASPSAASATPSSLAAIPSSSPTPTPSPSPSFLPAKPSYTPTPTPTPPSPSVVSHPPTSPAPSAAPVHTLTATPTPTATATSLPTAASDAVQRVLAVINQARAAHGLPAYTITAGLAGSAQTHNQVMASGCGLSHQCPGEPGLGARVTAQGVRWTAVGENIGYGGPVSTAAQDTAAQAVGLTQDMLNEQPPNDGHRRNILSSSFTHIGIAVYRDANGTVWLTQDFSS